MPAPCCAHAHTAASTNQHGLTPNNPLVNWPGNGQRCLCAQGLEQKADVCLHIHGVVEIQDDARVPTAGAQTHKPTGYQQSSRPPVHNPSIEGPS